MSIVELIKIKIAEAELVITFTETVHTLPLSLYFTVLKQVWHFIIDREAGA